MLDLNFDQKGFVLVGWTTRKRSTAHVNSQGPLARDEGLVIEELGDELLVYDLDVKHAHCLTPTAAKVWRACDGSSRDSLVERLDMEPEAVDHALAELQRIDLLAPLTPVATGDTRRDFGFKVAKVTAAAAALPVVLSVAAPAAAQTQSNITFCFDLTGPEGTNNCNTCNGITGDNTLCCCCHKPKFLPDGTTPFSSTINNAKLCSPDGTFCTAVIKGSECTENNNPT